MCPRDGSGTYSRPVDDYVYNTVISETSVNTEMAQIATALTDSLAKDGQTTPTADLPMGGFKHTGVGDGTKRDQYASVGQLQDNEIAWAIAGGTAQAFTANLSPVISELTDGMMVGVRAISKNTEADPTFSLNGLAAKTVKKYNGVSLVAGDITGSGHELLLLYDSGGDYWKLLNPAKPNNAVNADNASLLDSIDSTSFLRSDADGSASGNLTFSGLVALSNKIIVGGTGVPGIHLAIGDTDTGFKWVSDGNFQAFANAIDIIEYSSSNVKFNVRPHYGSSNLVALSDWVTNTSSTGYLKFPNGIIFQWGSTSCAANTDTDASLPLTLPNGGVQGFATHATGGAGSANAIAPGVVSFTSTTIKIRNVADGTTTIRWMLIGL